MKKGKITRGLLLSVFFLSILFFRIPEVFASSNISDVCDSELKENFESFCNENGNASLSLDIFGNNEEKDDSKLQPMVFSKSVSNVQNENEIIISENEEWSEDKVIENKIVAIMPGIELRIKEGVTIYLKNSLIGVAGKLIAEGTKEKPITFRKLESQSNQGFFIYSGLDSQGIEGDEIRMKYVDLSGGFNSSVYGVVTVGNAKLEIKESKIHNNKIAVVVAGSVAEEKQVSRTKFFSNEFDVTSYFYPIPGKLLPNFQYNWWGSSGGPKRETQCYTEGCVDSYKKIQGYIDLKPWFVSDDFHDPIIIIPGILGSENKDGVWQIDPVFHTYDNLYEEFVSNGFIPDEDVFTFPYEWRDSNVENAKLLRDKINEIKQTTGYSQVDIVAHSMGGLLAREYIESNYYQNDVDQLVTLGTPHNGAPEAYMKWEAGAFLNNLSEIYFKHKFSQETEENGYENIFDYIQKRPIVSVKELLPVYGYLYDVENENKLREYPDDYPINDFLENLNSERNIKKLNNVLFYKIIGNVNDSGSTISGFSVINSGMGEYWEHGYPHGFEILIGDRGLIKNDGDETVPLESAKSNNIFANRTIELDSSHIGLPTNAQSDILEILNGLRPEDEVRHSMIRDILLISVFSPVDIQIISPDGKRLGKDFDSGKEINEIPEAYYSGFNTDTEFLTVPNSTDGEYKILAEGTGDGEYEIEINRIFENDETEDVEEASASISDLAQLGKVKEKKIQVSKEEIKIIEENITVDLIIKKIKEYYEQGLIKRKSDRNFLVARLEFIKEAQETIDRLKENIFINEKIKERIIENFESFVNWNLDFLINYIKIKSEYGLRKDIDPEVGELLIKNLNFIKYK